MSHAPSAVYHRLGNVYGAALGETPYIIPWRTMQCYEYFMDFSRNSNVNSLQTKNYSNLFNRLPDVNTLPLAEEQ